MKSFYAAGAVIAAGFLGSLGWAQAPHGQFGYPSVLGSGSSAAAPIPFPYYAVSPRTAAAPAGQTPHLSRLQQPPYYTAGVGSASPAVVPPAGPVSAHPVGSGVANGIVAGPSCQSGACGVPSAQGFQSYDAAMSDCGCLPPPPPAQCCTKWFGGVYGLIMTRSNEDDRYLLYDPYVDDRMYLNAADASMEWVGGVEARIGRTFNNCCWGIEGVYWGLYPSNDESWVEIWNTPSAALHTTMDLSEVWLDFYDPGTNTWWNNNVHNAFNDGCCPVQAAAVSRTFEFHNAEINFLSGPMYRSPCCNPCGPTYAACGADPCGANGCCPPPRPKLQVGWLMGFRWFKFREGFHFALENGDGVIDYWSTPNNEFYYDIDVDNNLYGLHLGCNMDYFVTPCLHLEAGLKFGVFANHMEHEQRMYNQHGNAYIDPGNPQDFYVRSNDTDLASLGELRAGVGYRFGCHWRWTGGYRVVALGGLALTADQIPYGQTYGALQTVNNIDSNSCVVLHGAYTGLEFAF